VYDAIATFILLGLIRLIAIGWKTPDSQSPKSESTVEFIHSNWRQWLERGLAYYGMAFGALAIYMLTQFDRHHAGFQFVVASKWIPEWGIGWHLGVHWQALECSDMGCSKSAMPFGKIDQDDGISHDNPGQGDEADH